MSKSLLHDWESSIEKNKNNTEELLKIAEDIYNTAYASAKANARPQGEWIDYNAYYKTCSICKRTVGIDFLIQSYENPPKRINFCPNCGAEMKGGAE